jgi:hypothetical protein
MKVWILQQTRFGGGKKIDGIYIDEKAARKELRKKNICYDCHGIWRVEEHTVISK